MQKSTNVEGPKVVRFQGIPQIINIDSKFLMGVVGSNEKFTEGIVNYGKNVHLPSS